MNHHAGPCAFLLIPLMLLAACGSGSGQQHTARVLDQRLQATLASEVASGQAVVQKTPTGDRVTLLALSSFPNGPRALEDQSRDVRADVIEGLLDPALMRVQMTDSSTLPLDQRNTRVRNVAEYFIANGLGPVLVPPDASSGGPAGPAGLAITINLACPPPNGFIGYGDGTAQPVCD